MTKYGITKPRWKWFRPPRWKCFYWAYIFDDVSVVKETPYGFTIKQHQKSGDKSKQIQIANINNKK